MVGSRLKVLAILLTFGLFPAAAAAQEAPTAAAQEPPFTPSPKEDAPFAEGAPAAVQALPFTPSPKEAAPLAEGLGNTPRRMRTAAHDGTELAPSYFSDWGLNLGVAASTPYDSRRYDHAGTGLTFDVLYKNFGINYTLYADDEAAKTGVKQLYGGKNVSMQKVRGGLFYAAPLNTIDFFYGGFGALVYDDSADDLSVQIRTPYYTAALFSGQPFSVKYREYIYFVNAGFYRAYRNIFFKADLALPVSGYYTLKARTDTGQTARNSGHMKQKDLYPMLTLAFGFHF